MKIEIYEITLNYDFAEFVMTVTEVFVCGMFAITMTFTPYQIRIGRGSTSISNQNSRTSHRIDAVGCLATLFVTGRSVKGLGPLDEGACKLQVVTKSTAKSGHQNGFKAYTVMGSEFSIQVMKINCGLYVSKIVWRPYSLMTINGEWVGCL